MAITTLTNLLHTYAFALGGPSLAARALKRKRKDDEMKGKKVKEKKIVRDAHADMKQIRPTFSLSYQFLHSTFIHPPFSISQATTGSRCIYLRRLLLDLGVLEDLRFRDGVAFLGAGFFFAGFLDGFFLETTLELLEDLPFSSSITESYASFTKLIILALCAFCDLLISFALALSAEISASLAFSLLLSSARAFSLAARTDSCLALIFSTFSLLLSLRSLIFLLRLPEVLSEAFFDSEEEDLDFFSFFFLGAGLGFGLVFSSFECSTISSAVTDSSRYMTKLSSPSSSSHGSLVLG
mmetsp:Transcript_729/g.1302  ORF Transcript_729/g.1302 Transcript_729/m.1302 type:complete len:296 (+) Transcript_729:422-1309(+)